MVLTENLPGDSHANYVRIPCIVFFVVTPIFLGIRLWNRVVKQSGIGMDDYTILLSFASTLTVSILMMLSCNYGFGKHIKDIAPHNLEMAMKLFFVAQIFYKITINLTKASILLLYLRIFVQRWFRICCYIMLGLVISYLVATTAATIWQCTPIERAWNMKVPGTCISLTKNWYANAGFAIATDVIILCLPMQPLWTSSLQKSQKLALMFVFALGFFLTATSIMRSTTLRFSTQTPDVTYDIESTLWTVIEIHVAIICACLPMCRMILQFLLPGVFGATAGRPGGSTNPAIVTIGSAPPKARTHPEAEEEWQPYSGPNKLERSGVGMAHGPCDASSEEYMLADVPRPSSDEQDGTIRKTMQYKISYENKH